MNISRALAYITDDDDWLQKLLIGGLISLIPLVGQIYALGYATAVLKNIIAGQEAPLPDLTEDFGDKLIHGLLVWVMIMIYMLPLIIVATVSGIGIAVVAGAADSDVAGILAATTGSCAGLFMLALGIVSGLFVPYAWGRYAECGLFGQAFKLNDFFEMIKANLGQTLMVLLVAAVIGAIAGSVGTAVCAIGVAFTSFYARLVTSFLYGKLYLQAKAKTQ
jgi:hypothetical protein